MSVATLPAAAKTGRGSREVGKVSKGAALQAVASREEVGKESGNTLSTLPSPPHHSPTRPPTLPLAPSLVRKAAPKARKAAPATITTTAREGWPASAPFTTLRDLPAPELAVVDAALAILARRLSEPAVALQVPQAAREYVRLALAGIEREVFGVLFLDAAMRLIEWRVLFAGTLTRTAVHPREVVRAALRVNAHAVILAHNHPSGIAEPSRADELLTTGLRHALAMVDVRVVDHLVVGWPHVTSFAERGLL